MPRQKRPILPVPALGAQALVFHIVHRVDGDLRAFKHVFAVYLAAVAGGLSPALADGLHLLNGVGQLQKTGGTGETPRHEIRPQAVANHRDAQVHRHQKQLVHLFGGEKLALIAQHAGGRAVLRHVPAHNVQHVHVGSNQHIHRTAHPQAGHHLALPLGVDGGLEQQHPHPPFLIVKGNLQQRRGLAAVHCAVTEIQLCHKTFTPCFADGSPDSSGCLPNVRFPPSGRDIPPTGRNG